MTGPDWDPLTATPPSEIHLPEAPLIRVLAQVRYPTIAAIETTPALAPFQEAIRESYPFLRQERGQGVTISGAGIQAAESVMLWRFTQTNSPAPTEGWSIVLTKDFLALETTRYSSRKDFLFRLETATKALSEAFRPPALDRLGIRFIDRVTGNDAANINALVHPWILGVLSLPVAAHVKQHALTEVLFSIPNGGSMRARWAQLPPSTTIDPASIEPVNKPSWVLDLDAFTDQQMPFDTGAIIERATHFTERIYAFFRWAVTDEFLRRFGGNP